MREKATDEPLAHPFTEGEDEGFCYWYKHDNRCCGASPEAHDREHVMQALALDVLASRDRVNAAWNAWIAASADHRRLLEKVATARGAQLEPHE